MPDINAIPPSAAIVAEVLLTLGGVFALVAQAGDWWKNRATAKVRPWTAPVLNFLVVIGAVALAQLVVPTVFLAAGKTGDAYIFPMAIATQCVCLVVLLRLVFVLHPDFSFRAVGAVGVRRSLVWHPVVCFIGAVALTVVAAGVAQALGALFWPDVPLDKKQDSVLLLMRHRDEWPFMLVAALAVGVVAPVAEELFFRGVVYPFFKRFGGVAFAAGVTGVFFGAVHCNWFALLPLAAFGTYLCLIYEKTGSIRIPIVVHGLFNLSTLVITLVTPEG